MLKELVESLVKLGEDRKKVQIVEKPDGRAVYITAPDGQWIECPTVKSYRHHVCHSLKSFTEAVSQFVTDTGSVWITEDYLAALCDDQERMDRIEMSLFDTDGLGKVIEMCNRLQPHDKFIRGLRTDLRDVVDSDLTRRLSRLSFKRGVDAESNLKHDQESLGKRVESSVQAADELPEHVTLNVKYYTNDGCTASRRVDATLVIDFASQELGLFLKPDSLLQGRQQVLAEIAQFVSSEVSVPVFLGKP